MHGDRPVRNVCHEKEITEASSHQWRGGLLEVDQNQLLKRMAAEVGAQGPSRCKYNIPGDSLDLPVAECKDL